MSRTLKFPQFMFGLYEASRANAKMPFTSQDVVIISN